MLKKLWYVRNWEIYEKKVHDIYCLRLLLFGQPVFAVWIRACWRQFWVSSGRKCWWENQKKFFPARGSEQNRMLRGWTVDGSFQGLFAPWCQLAGAAAPFVKWFQCGRNGGCIQQSSWCWALQWWKLFRSSYQESAIISTATWQFYDRARRSWKYYSFKKKYKTRYADTWFFQKAKGRCFARQADGLSNTHRKHKGKCLAT